MRTQRLPSILLTGSGEGNRGDVDAVKTRTAPRRKATMVAKSKLQATPIHAHAHTPFSSHSGRRRRRRRGEREQARLTAQGQTTRLPERTNFRYITDQCQCLSDYEKFSICSSWMELHRRVAVASTSRQEQITRVNLQSCYIISHAWQKEFGKEKKKNIAGPFC